MADEGVREKRGAGAGCGTPSTSVIVPRSAMCGSVGTSSNDNTGVTHASVREKIARQ